RSHDRRDTRERRGCASAGRRVRRAPARYRHERRQAVRGPDTARARGHRHGVDRARADGGGRAVVMTHGLDDVSPEDDTRRDAIVGLATTLLERDRYTGDHSEAVVQLTVRVAQALALNPDEVGRVESAALLHDIGKVGIPDSILHKNGPLDDDEWVLMKEHPVIGERILRAI